MTNYGGSFVQGLAGGLQTGFGMGQKIQEMRWQKEQMKKLEKEKELLQTNLSSILSDPANQEYLAKLSSGGDVYSPEGINFTATLFGVSKDLANYIADLQKDIHAGNRKDAEMKFENLKVLTEGMVDLNLEGMMTNPDFGIGNLASEESMRYKRAAETYKNTPKENMPYGMTKEVAGMAGLAGMPEAMPTTPDQPPTELELQTETQKKLDYAYNTGNASHFNAVAKAEGVDTTFDTYKQKYEKPEVGGGTTDTKTRATSLTTLEKYRENALNADSWEESEKIIKDYTDADYDVTQLGVTQQDWANVKKSDLDNLVAVLNEITAGTPESRNIKGKKKFAFAMDGKETEKTGEEWYKAVYESYNVLSKLLEEQGVDVSQYKKLKPLSEIKKIKFGGFVGAGVETGDLISIYY